MFYYKYSSDNYQFQSIVKLNNDQTAKRHFNQVILFDFPVSKLISSCYFYIPAVNGDDDSYDRWMGQMVRQIKIKIKIERELLLKNNYIIRVITSTGKSLSNRKFKKLEGRRVLMN